MNDAKTIAVDRDAQCLSAIRQFVSALQAHYSAEEVERALQRYLNEKVVTRAAEHDHMLAYFDQAWQMWPLVGRRRSSKQKARKLFCSIAESGVIGPTRLLDAINRYVLSPDATRMDGAYAPGLDRWLSQGKWEAWLESAAPKRVGWV